MMQTMTRFQADDSLSSKCREPISMADLEAVVGGQWDFTVTLTNAAVAAASGNVVGSPRLR